MAIRRPPTTFSDTISTADIADDAITGGKLANDIAISTTGNIATTGSGTLTVAGNTTLSGTNNLGSNPTLTLGSNATFPAGHVINTAKVFANSTHSNTNSSISATTGYTGLTVSLTVKQTGSYIIVKTSGNVYLATSDGLQFKIYRDVGGSYTDVTECGSTGSTGALQYETNHAAAHYQLNTITYDSHGVTANGSNTVGYRLSVGPYHNGHSSQYGNAGNYPCVMILQEIAV